MARQRLISKRSPIRSPNPVVATGKFGSLVDFGTAQNPMIYGFAKAPGVIESIGRYLHHFALTSREKDFRMVRRVGARVTGISEYALKAVQTCTILRVPLLLR